MYGYVKKALTRLRRDSISIQVRITLKILLKTHCLLVAFPVEKGL